MTDMLDLMKADPKLKIVLKNSRCLGPAHSRPRRSRSPRACRIRRKKYLDFHQKLLGGRGQADKAHAMAAAKASSTWRNSKDVAGGGTGDP